MTKKLLLKTVGVLSVSGLMLTYLWNIRTDYLVHQAPEWVHSTPIAHRGLHSNGVPENTLQAFQNAADKGFAVELDVHLSKDGVPMVFHDEHLDRLTEFKGDITTYSSEELKNIHVDGTQQTIPTLKQVFEVVQGRVPIYIEIKNWENLPGIEQKVWEETQKYTGPFAIISFNPYVLKWFKNKDPKIFRGQTACGFDDEDDRRRLPWYKRLLIRNFLLNFLSEPHFVTYELEAVPNWSATAVSKFLPMLTYGTKTLRDRKKALAVGVNFMFDHIGEHIHIPVVR